MRSRLALALIGMDLAPDLVGQPRDAVVVRFAVENVPAGEAVYWQIDAVVGGAQAALPPLQ